jgi:hypothetical protein
MADPYPLYPEVEPAAANAPYCGSSAVGCTVSSTASMITRFKGYRITDLKALGRSMGARHRAQDSRVTHGICPDAWCHYCMYLELKARGIPVAYGNLTWAQIMAHVKAGHPVAIPYKYGVLRRVAPSSYSATTPARGRVDGFLGSHSSVIWAVSGFNLIVSDPDFGMSWAPVPPHSLIANTTLKAAWGAYGWGSCYAIQKPPALAEGIILPPKPVPGVNYQTQWGAGPFSRGTYAANQSGVNVRKSPFVRPTNVVDKLTKGERFVCAQSTRAGTNVGGSSLWHGNAKGDQWVHRSVVHVV